MAKDKEPVRDDYRNEASYQSALRKYRVRKDARRVWVQISPEEKAWALENYTSLKGEQVMAALEKDTAAGGDLSALKFTQKQLRSIARYPRSEHRRHIYKATLAASSSRKDVRVRKHEKRLRERGV